MGFDPTGLLVFIPIALTVLIVLVAIKFAEWHIAKALKFLGKPFRQSTLCEEPADSTSTNQTTSTDTSESQNHSDPTEAV